MELAIAAGAISCTTNPTYGAKLLQSEPEFVRGIIERVVKTESSDDDASDVIVQHSTERLIRRFLPLYEKSGATEGFVTIQSDPRRDEDAGAMVDAALRYRRIGPNFMAKIPVTAAGLDAIAALIPENIPICATEVFALDQAIAVCKLYKSISDRSGRNPPMFVTHITGIFDEYLSKLVEHQGFSISMTSLPWAGSTVARAEYRLIKERGYPVTLLGGGARSTRHFTDFIGGEFHITINWSTAKELIDWDPPVVSRIDVPTPPEILAELTDMLPDFRRALEVGSLRVEEFAEFGPVQLFRNNFIAGYERLLSEISLRRLS